MGDVDPVTDPSHKSLCRSTVAVCHHQHLANGIDVHRVLRLLERLLHCHGAPLDHLGVICRHDLLSSGRCYCFCSISDLAQCIDVVRGIRDGVLKSLPPVFSSLLESDVVSKQRLLSPNYFASTYKSTWDEPHLQRASLYQSGCQRGWEPNTSSRRCSKCCRLGSSRSETGMARIGPWWST